MDVYNKFNRNGNSFSTLTRLDKFKERVSYDPNGNILKYLRNGDGNDNAAHFRMDSLQYNYYAGSNRLRNVRDSVPANWYGANATDKIVDIDNQVDTDNYIYDSIGNLIQDKAEKITNINWNVYGKITGISRGAGTQVPASEISYTHDASGNRIRKSVEKGGRKTITWYVRDAQGNVMATYSSDAPAATPLQEFALNESERYIYGSSRLGVVTVAQAVDNGNAGPGAVVDTGGVFLRGERMYELSNHLGNVLVTISDKKKGIADPITSSLISHFEPIMLSGTDYYPFGMPMRVGGDNKYKYGFNGKENDNEVKWGMGNQQDYGMRIYDPRLGRFLSVDPIAREYPWYTPYQFAGNKPIRYVDLDGLEEALGIFERMKREGPTAIFRITWKDVNITADGFNRNFNPIGVTAHGTYATVSGKDMGTGQPVNRMVAFSDMSVNLLTMYAGTKLPAATNTTSLLEQQMTKNARSFENAVEAQAKNTINSQVENTLTKETGRKWGPVPNSSQGYHGMEFLDDGLRTVDQPLLSYDNVLNSASELYKGSTTLGHALSKHANRGVTDIWGTLKGDKSTWHSQALKHFDEIMKGPGSFETITNKDGIKFLEKRISDGRGIRLNMDGTFKGLID